MMNNFNEFYKLILQSIITQDIQSKIRKAIQTLIKSGQLKDQNDPKIQLVKTIIKRNNSIDINGKTKLDQLLKANQKYVNRAEAKKSSYLDSIKQFSQKKEYPNGVVIYRVQQSEAGQQAVRKIIDDQWSKDANPWCLASRDGNGLEGNFKHFWIGTYNAFPKHIAFQNGKLLAFCANNHGNCTWWDRKDVSHKKLPLLNGQQMQTQKYEWTPEEKKYMWCIRKGLVLNKKTNLWDSKGDVRIQNKDLINGHFPVKFGVIKGDFKCFDCYDLKSLDGAPKEIRGGVNYDGCKNMPGYEQYVKNKFLHNNGLELNEQTKRYDSRGDIRILFNNGVFNGHFVIPFGVINGNFTYVQNDDLTSLKNAPKEVKGKFECINCPNLVDIKDLPKKIEGYINFKGSINVPNYDQYQIQRFIKMNHLILDKKTQLYNSEGNVQVTDEFIYKGRFPVKFGVINGDFDCHDCKKLKHLDGAPTKVIGKTNYDGCKNLKVIDQKVYAKFIEKNNLIYNSSTGRYDCDHSIYVDQDIILKGHFMLPFGVIKGNFTCSWNPTLKDLTNGPTYVEGSYNCGGCARLTSLQGAPKKVGRSFSITDNPRLMSLVGCPEEISENFDCHGCQNLNSLQYGPKIVSGDYNCSSTNLSNLLGAPREVGGKFDCSYNSLTSLIGAPRKVGGKFDCYRANITTLQGGPQWVGGDFDCTYTDITNLEGAPKYIGGKQLRCTYCDKLTSLIGVSDELKDKVNPRHCPNLHESEDLQLQYYKRDFIQNNQLVLNESTGRWDSNSNDLRLAYNLYKDTQLLFPLGQIKGNFTCNTEVDSFKNFPIKVGGNCTLEPPGDHLDFKTCPIKYVGGDYKITGYNSAIKKITNLVGCPEYVGGDFKCSYCSNLSSIEGLPKTIKGRMIFEECPNLPVDVKKKSFISREKLILNQQTQKYDLHSDESMYIKSYDLIDGKIPVNLGKIEGDFKIRYQVVANLVSLQGCPQKVGGKFEIQSWLRDTKLTSLVGGPKEVGGDFICKGCDEQIPSLIGAPQKIGGNFECSIYKSFEGFPQEIGGYIELSGRSFPKDTPEEFNNIVRLRYQRSWQNAPKVINGDLWIDTCHENLIGMPKVTGTLFIYSNNITSLQGAVGKVEKIKIYKHSLTRYNRSAKLTAAAINRYKNQIDIQIIS